MQDTRALKIENLYLPFALGRAVTCQDALHSSAQVREPRFQVLIYNLFSTMTCQLQVKVEEFECPLSIKRHYSLKATIGRIIQQQAKHGTAPVFSDTSPTFFFHWPRRKITEDMKNWTTEVAVVLGDEDFDEVVESSVADEHELEMRVSGRLLPIKLSFSPLTGLHLWWPPYR